MEAAAAPPSPDAEPQFRLGELAFPAPEREVASPAAGEDPGRGSRRRRAPALAGGPPRPAFLAGTDPILRWGTPALLALAPLARGSVDAWSELLVVAGAAVIGGVWLLRLALHPDRLAEERASGGHAASWSAGLLVPFLAVLAVGLVQLAPLGPFAAAASPVGAQIQREAGAGTWGIALTLGRQPTQRALAQLVAFGLLFFAVWDGLPGRAEVRRLAAACVAAGFAHALGGILWHYQSTGRAYWGPTGVGNPFGPYVNRNHFAALMGMTIPLGVGLMLSLAHRRGSIGAPRAGASRAAHPARGAQRFLIGFAVIVAAGALGLSLSRGGIVSTLCALSALAVVVGVRRVTRGHLWKASAAIAAGLAFTAWLAGGPLLSRLGTLAGLLESEAVAAPRTGIWRDTARLAADYPLFGTGYGTFGEVYPSYQTAHPGRAVRHAHNDWLQLVAEGGLAASVAVLVLVGSYGAAAARLLRRRRDGEAILLGLGALASVLVFLLHAGVEFNARIPANALWFTVVAALALKTLASRREAEAAP